MQLGGILGDRNKIDMLLGLYLHGPRNKTEVYAFTVSNNLNARKLDELKKIDLIEMRKDPESNGVTVSLTDLGDAVGARLRDIDCLLSGEFLPEAGKYLESPSWPDGEGNKK